MARNYAVLPHEYLEEMDCLSDAEFGRLMRALLVYSSTGKLPALSGNEKILAKRVVMQEDRYQQYYSDLTEKRSDAGKKGMASRWGDKGITADNKDNNVTPVITADNKDNYTETKTKTKTEINPVTDVTGRDTRTREALARHKYGQYDNVLLSDEDLSKLQSEFPTDWEARIERLSEYMAYKGVSYKSHLATIRAWARKDAQQPTQPPPQKEESFAELAARMAQKGVR